MRRLCILGSTGSIGTQTLKLVAQDNNLHAEVLAANSNIKLLKQQIDAFHPSLVCVFQEDKANELRAMLSAEGLRTPEVVSGMDGLIRCAQHPDTETVVVAVVGMIGIQPTIAAIRAHKKIALANKETLVCAGHLIMPLVKETGVSLMPVDSEHSAIYQCLVGEEKKSLKKILLTASGGPFRGRSREELRGIRPVDALKHPNWSMGAKITIDSSTMVNKALEVIEARWLFDVPVSDIQVVIQPQSIIHSMVEFRDGAVKAQLGVPSMLLPIAYALYAPERISLPEETLDFWKLSELRFYPPDYETFEGLALGRQAGEAGGMLPTIFNAANEEAVAAFLHEACGYLDIPAAIRTAMETLAGDYPEKTPGVAEILQAERDARSLVRRTLRL